MSESKHTSGPWDFCTGSHKDCCICGIVRAANDTSVAMVTMRRCQFQDHGATAPIAEESKANVRLIAAAPDLLAALEQMWRIFTPSHEDPEGLTVGGQACLAAQAAIVKAKGEEI